MWPHYPELLTTPVPRYTSFPTAAEFSDEVGAEDMDRALASAVGDISIYVHIPFCHRICWYCGCNTAAANRQQRLVSYLGALHKEIALVAGRLPAGARVRRMAFGGGSPNAMSPDQFERLLDSLGATFSLAVPVITAEFDPRTLTEDWAPVLRRIGLANASLGVQTFAAHLQQAIGRVQPLDMIERSVGILREAGVRSLNFDLMYGLPGQQEADLVETLEIASTLGTDRIALFGYAHVPQLMPRQRRIDASALPDLHQRFRMAELGHRQLTAAGYVPIGFDHFARPRDPLARAGAEDRLHRNFQGFTDDSAQVLLGFGASAISSFPELLAQNERNAGRYRMLLSQGRLPAVLGKRRTLSDRRRADIIEQLLCQGKARIDAATMLEAQSRLSPLIEAGLCAFVNGQLTIHAHALPYSRVIAACFDPYRNRSPRRFSSAV